MSIECHHWKEGKKCWIVVEKNDKRHIIIWAIKTIEENMLYVSNLYKKLKIKSPGEMHCWNCMDHICGHDDVDLSQEYKEKRVQKKAKRLALKQAK